MSRLEELRRVASRGSGALALYRCSCGTIVERLVRKVADGSTSSCGCLKRDVNRARCTTHGGSKSAIYKVWFEMVQRCHNTGHKDWNLYGARGISVCRRWRKSFADFRHDMGTRPNGFTVERLKNNLGYAPSNCVWASQKDQANNKRSTLRIEHSGKTLTLRQWEGVTGLPYKTLRSRHQSGWSPDRMLSTPKRGT